MTIATEPDDYNADVHEPDATGFPDGEGESAEALQELVNEAQEAGIYVDPPTAREKANEWDEAIREAAAKIARELVSLDDTEGLPFTNDQVAYRAYQAIIYKLQWVARTGQGMRDIV